MATAARSNLLAVYTFTFALIAGAIACGDDGDGTGFGAGTGYTPQDAAAQPPLPPGAGPFDGAPPPPPPPPPPQDSGSQPDTGTVRDSGTTPTDSGADSAG